MMRRCSSCSTAILATSSKLWQHKNCKKFLIIYGSRCSRCLFHFLQFGADFQYSHNRNWRYHKKLRCWLTKDEMMVPQPLGNGTERGYYVFFDLNGWTRERVSNPLFLNTSHTLTIFIARVHPSLWWPREHSHRSSDSGQMSAFETSLLAICRVWLYSIANSRAECVWYSKMAGGMHISQAAAEHCGMISCTLTWMQIWRSSKSVAHTYNRSFWVREAWTGSCSEMGVLATWLGLHNGNKRFMTPNDHGLFILHHWVSKNARNRDRVVQYFWWFSW